MKGKNGFFLAVVIFLAVFFLFAPYRNANTFNFALDTDSFTVTGPEDFAFTVSYDQIERMELFELSDPGSAVTGSENRSIRWGEWENSVFGKYTVCAAKRTDTVILITTRENAYFAFNYHTQKETEKIYQAFSEWIEQQTQES